MINSNESVPMFEEKMTREEWQLHEEWVERRTGRDIDTINRLKNRMFYFYFLLADGRKS